MPTIADLTTGIDQKKLRIENLKREIAQDKKTLRALNSRLNHQADALAGRACRALIEQNIQVTREAILEQADRLATRSQGEALERLRDCLGPKVVMKPADDEVSPSEGPMGGETTASGKAMADTATEEMPASAASHTRVAADAPPDLNTPVMTAEGASESDENSIQIGEPHAATTTSVPNKTIRSLPGRPVWRQGLPMRGS